MTKLEFEELWLEYVVNPLLKLGFQESGKSLFMIKNNTVLSLIRLGGRHSEPGSICHTFCLRHSFLRNLDEKSLKGFEREPFAYPIKCVPSKIANICDKDWMYSPQNLKFPRERFHYFSLNKKQVVNDLVNLQIDLARATELLPFKFTTEFLEDQIQKLGEDAWIENVWLEDYRNYQT